MNVAVLSLSLRDRGFGLYLKILLMALSCVGGAYAQTVSSGQGGATEYRVPIEITPEAVLALQARGVPYQLIEARQAAQQVQSVSYANHIRIIYYTAGPSSRAAHDAVLRDRGAASSAHEPSQRLTGTPVEWLRLGLNFSGSRTPKLERPTVISPKALSEAIKDGVDLQIIDLRPMPLPVSSAKSGAAPVASLFPGAVSLLPHQLDAEKSTLSKLRWTVLVDNGNRVAEPIADRLFQQGYTLICILEGGYPAWISATNR